MGQKVKVCLVGRSNYEAAVDAVTEQRYSCLVTGSLWFKRSEEAAAISRMLPVHRSGFSYLNNSYSDNKHVRLAHGAS